jgi:hypothetical protein
MRAWTKGKFHLKTRLQNCNFICETLEPVRWIRGEIRWKVILVSFLYIYSKCASFKSLYFLTCHRTNKWLKVLQTNLSYDTKSTETMMEQPHEPPLLVTSFCQDIPTFLPFLLFVSFQNEIQGWQKSYVLQFPVANFTSYIKSLLVHSSCSRVKVKVVPWLFLTEHHTMETYWGSGGISPLILWPRH